MTPAETQAKLRAGIQALRAGDRARGRRLLLEVVAADERIEPAWLWLSAALDDPADQIMALENALALNPDNAPAVTIFLDDVEWTNEGPDVDAGVPPDSGVHPDASLGDGGAGGTALPFWVDDHYAMSGFMGGGSVQADPCPANPGSAVSPCRRITWTPGAAEWAGFYFQYPANNWTMPGLPIAPGARRVSFYVWGMTGTESLNFAAGLNAVDGFQLETGYSVVSTARTLRTIDLSAVNYPNGVAGAFAWFVNNPGGAGTVTFFLDDVQWE